MNAADDEIIGIGSILPKQIGMEVGLGELHPCQDADPAAVLLPDRFNGLKISLGVVIAAARVQGMAVQMVGKADAAHPQLHRPLAIGGKGGVGIGGKGGMDVEIVQHSGSPSSGISRFYPMGKGEKMQALFHLNAYESPFAQKKRTPRGSLFCV